MAAERSDGESDGTAFGEAVESCDGGRAIGESSDGETASAGAGGEAVESSATAKWPST